MKKILFFVIGITMTSLAISQTASPELVSSAGESFNNTSYRLDWSIGECVTATHSSGSYVITQGFHQNSYVATLVKDLRADMKMSVYPNPTSDFISLKVESSKIAGMQYTVTDFSGKVLETAEIRTSLQTLNFTNYPVGTYFISVTENMQLIKSFKIIKN